MIDNCILPCGCFTFVERKGSIVCAKGYPLSGTSEAYVKCFHYINEVGHSNTGQPMYIIYNKPIVIPSDNILSVMLHVYVNPEPAASTIKLNPLVAK